ncbi:MAG: hypothetical protein AAB795_01055 [Patescibacteria group bacterium]
MKNETAPQEKNWNNYKVRHFKTGQGELVEYRDKKTGKVAKIIMRGANGELTTMECDPNTGKLSELIEYDKNGEMIRLQDQKAIREALKDNNIWHARMLDEIKIQHGNIDAATAMIDQMLNDEILAVEQQQ